MRGVLPSPAERAEGPGEGASRAGKMHPDFPRNPLLTLSLRPSSP
jgi:hypothetical protein